MGTKRLRRKLRRLAWRIATGRLDWLPGGRKARLVDRLAGLLRHPGAWVKLGAADCILAVWARQQEEEARDLPRVGRRSGPTSIAWREEGGFSCLARTHPVRRTRWRYGGPLDSQPWPGQTTCARNRSWRGNVVAP